MPDVEVDPVIEELVDALERVGSERDRARRVAVALEAELALLEDLARYAAEVRRYCPSNTHVTPIEIPADTLAMLTAALDRYERTAHA